VVAIISLIGIGLLPGMSSAGAVTSSTASITTSPAALSPTFSTSITDYVVRCSSSPTGPGTVTVNVGVPAGSEAFLNSGGGHTGNFSSPVTMAPGQAFTVTMLNLAAGSGKTYHVRCLPSDFPNYTTSKPGSSQAQFYMTTAMYPNLISPSTPVQTQYVALWSTDGAPVWWLPIHEKTFTGTLLSNGDVGWDALTGFIREHALTGQQVRSVTRSDLDGHELIVLPNGNYLVAVNFSRTGVDLSALGGPSNGNVLDHRIVELTPAGNVAWSWTVGDHISPNETPQEWWGGAASTGGGLGWDVYHWNSADERVVNGRAKVLLSFRHQNAVFEVDRDTGAIDFKLGGTHTADSMSVEGDPVFTAGGTLSGQHDARFFADNEITLHDNGNATNPSDPTTARHVRGVRYSVNRDLHSAALQESITDDVNAPDTAFCCGEARKLQTGNWVAAWGFHQVVDELAPGGALQSSIKWTDSGFVNYRGFGIPQGVLSLNALRSDMDTQYGHST
jgi:hypothetical protein